MGEGMRQGMWVEVLGDSAVIAGDSQWIGVEFLYVNCVSFHVFTEDVVQCSDCFLLKMLCFGFIPDFKRSR